MASAVFFDRVKETTTTTGTGTYSLGGAATGFEAFATRYTTGQTAFYCCEDGTNWEIGEGTLTSGSPWTLARTTIHASSNADAAVNWGAGTRNIFNTIPARAAVPYYDEFDWTPTLTSDTPGSLAVTYTTQVGKGVRKGREITLWGYMTLASFTVGTATGNARISGSPYSLSATIPRAAGVIAYGTVNYVGTQTAPFANMLASSALIGLYASTDNGGISATSITAGGFASGTEIVVQITFMI